MAEAPEAHQTRSGRIIISVDAMGGDLGPAAVVGGLATSAKKNPEIGFILHGPASELEPLVARRKLGDRCEIRDCPDVVRMDDKPSLVLRQGQGTSRSEASSTVSTDPACGGKRQRSTAICGAVSN